MKQLMTAATGSLALAVSAYAGEMVAPTPSATDSGDFFTGFSVTDNSWYGYLGANYALNGDIDSTGWILHGVYGHGEYDYFNAIDIDGTVDQVDLGLGYQWVTDSGRYSLIAAGNYVDHDLDSVDLSNSVNGDETGVKFKGAVMQDLGAFTAHVMGEYSTAFDSYWSRSALTKEIFGLSVGPEFVAMGNEEWDEIRYGLSVGGINLGPASISLSGGYAESESAGSSDEEGFYSGIHANFRF